MPFRVSSRGSLPLTLSPPPAPAQGDTERGLDREMPPRWLPSRSHLSATAGDAQPALDHVDDVAETETLGASSPAPPGTVLERRRGYRRREARLLLSGTLPVFPSLISSLPQKPPSREGRGACWGDAAASESPPRTSFPPCLLYRLHCAPQTSPDARTSQPMKPSDTVPPPAARRGRGARVGHGLRPPTGAQGLRVCGRHRD